MGSGKTTVGRELARLLDRPFYDSDAQIEAEYGTSSRLLARQHGVDWLHRAEAKALIRAVSEGPPAVVAAAASIADMEHPGRVLGDGVVTVLLFGDAEVLADRARPGRHRRPVSIEEYRALTDRRNELLHAHVDLAIDVTSIPPETVIRAILRYCRGGSAAGEERRPEGAG